MNYIKYSFDTNVAKEVGVEEAVMLENIYYWILKNKANNKHFYDGNYWTYNTITAFEELFPFWSKKQITRILKKLEINNFIVTGNYNKVSYDRTKWYALTQKALCIFPNGEMDLPKRENGFPQIGKSNCLNGEIELTKQENRIDQKGKPIPNINTNINTNINVYSHWNSKNIINHKDLTKEIESAINKALKIYKEEEIINAIDTYKEILDSEFYFNYKWNLKDFLTRKNGISTFTSEGSNKVNYEDWRTSPNGVDRDRKFGPNTKTSKKFNIKIESNNELTDEERARAAAELI